MSWTKPLIAAEGYFELGLYDEAARVLDEIPPDDQQRREVRGVRVAVYMAEKKWAQAAEIAARLVEEYPDEAVWWIDFAYCVRRARSLEEAEGILTRAIAIHPHAALIRYNLACYASVTGRLQEARHRLEEALALDEHMHAMALADEDLKPLQGFLMGKA